MLARCTRVLKVHTHLARVSSGHARLHTAPCRLVLKACACVQPTCARSGHACAGVHACPCHRDGVQGDPPGRPPQQLLPQPRALALDGSGQLSLYTSPSLPNISLGLQGTVTVTNSHLTVSAGWGHGGGCGGGVPIEGLLGSP